MSHIPPFLPDEWLFLSILSNLEFKFKRTAIAFLGHHRLRPPGMWKLIWMRYYGDKNEHTSGTMSAAPIRHCGRLHPQQMNNGKMKSASTTLDEVFGRTPARPSVHCPDHPDNKRTNWFVCGWYIQQGALNKLDGAGAQVRFDCHNIHLDRVTR